MSIINNLKYRKSVKIFSDEKISDYSYSKLIEAANLTPTSMGLQPVRIVTVKSKGIRDYLDRATYYQPQLKSCDRLMVICIKDCIDSSYIDSYMELIAKTRNQEVSSLDKFKESVTRFISYMNETQYSNWAKNQAYITLGNILTSATFLDIDACAMEGFQSDEFDRILDLKNKGLESVVLCAIGKRSKSDPRGDEEKVRIQNCEFHVTQY